MSCSWPFAVSIRIGISSPSSRMARQTSKPFIPGSMMSRRITSGRLGDGGLEPGAAVAHGADLESLSLERVGQAAHQRRLVLDDQQPRPGRRHALHLAVETGQMNRELLPLPGALCT